LNRAVHIATEALLIAPSIDKTVCLVTLVNALQARFEWTGFAADMNALLVAGKEAVAFAERPAEKILSRNALGLAFLRQFERTKSLLALDSAINTLQEGLQISVETVTSVRTVKQTLCSNLFALQKRYELKRSLDDLENSISAGEEAMALSSHDHPGKALCSNHLGNSLQYLYKHTRSDELLERDIDQTTRCRLPLG
jgi:hypothetical protein